MKVIQATTELERLAAFKVRHDVFVKEQGVSASIERDDADQTATHVIGYIDQHPVACLRFISDGDTGKIGRMAVLKAYRGQQLGKQLMLETEKIMQQAGLRKSTLHAQTHATGFYEQLRYQTISEPFYEANIEHVVMVKSF